MYEIIIYELFLKKFSFERSTSVVCHSALNKLNEWKCEYLLWQLFKMRKINCKSTSK